MTVLQARDLGAFGLVFQARALLDQLCAICCQSLEIGLYFIERLVKPKLGASFAAVERQGMGIEGICFCQRNGLCEGGGFARIRAVQGPIMLG